MITLVLCLFLAWQFYLGYARGFLIQIFYTIGHLLSIVLASFYYRDLADKLTLWVPYASPEEGVSLLFFKQVALFDLSQVFYAGTAFLLLYTIFYGLVRFLGIFVHLFRWQFFDNQKGQLISGALSVWVTSFVLSMGLSLLATVPYNSLQTILSSSFLARLLINANPIITQIIEHFWITEILK